MHPCVLPDLLKGHERLAYELARLGPTLLLIQERQHVKPNRPSGQRAARFGVEPTEPRERAVVFVDAFSDSSSAARGARNQRLYARLQVMKMNGIESSAS